MRLDLFFSHKKLSGQVFIACTSQGTWFLWYRSPLFQIHRPTQFSAQSASLTRACSLRDFLRSSSRTHLSTSFWICLNVSFISVTFTFWSSSEHRSLMDAFSIKSLLRSSMHPLVWAAWFSRSLKPVLLSSSWEILSMILRVESSSSTLAFYPFILWTNELSAFSSSSLCSSDT